MERAWDDHKPKPWREALENETLCGEAKSTQVLHVWVKQPLWKWILQPCHPRWCQVKQRKPHSWAFTKCLSSTIAGKMSCLKLLSFGGSVMQQQTAETLLNYIQKYYLLLIPECSCCMASRSLWLFLFIKNLKSFNPFPLKLPLVFIPSHYLPFSREREQRSVI